MMSVWASDIFNRKLVLQSGGVRYERSVGGSVESIHYTFAL